VIVYDRTTGKILPLQKSPHFTKLGQWLLQNPNFEPVKPGTPQAKQILTRNKPQSQGTASAAVAVPAQELEAPTTPTTIKTPQQGDDLFSNPVKISTGATPPAAVKKPATVTAPGQHSANSGSVRSNVVVKNSSSLKAAVNSSKSSSSKKPTVVKREERPATVSKKEERPASSSSSSTKVKAEQERQNVRNILNGTLKARMSDFEHPEISKMSDDDIAAFAKDVEREMFLFFNRDTRDKYKTKYRSLKFNLSDVKNKTLLEKICARKVTAKQLVELPASALASEELAKWRETENKHTLEIITKSELESLAQNKIVVKTHKGEEIIEVKTASVEIPDDLESVIAKTVLSTEGRRSGGSVTSPLSSPSVTSSTGRKSDSHHHHHHKSSSSSSKHKRHRSRSPKHSHHKDRKLKEPKDEVKNHKISNKKLKLLSNFREKKLKLFVSISGPKIIARSKARQRGSKVEVAAVA
jgi:Transcription factor S-II (TFIIS), central domain/BRK domain